MLIQLNIYVCKGKTRPGSKHRMTGTDLTITPSGEDSGVLEDGPMTILHS